jgi:hypothetical protein
MKFQLQRLANPVATRTGIAILGQARTSTTTRDPPDQTQRKAKQEDTSYKQLHPKASRGRARVTLRPHPGRVIRSCSCVHACTPKSRRRPVPNAASKTSRPCPGHSSTHRRRHLPHLRLRVAVGVGRSRWEVAHACSRRPGVHASMSVQPPAAGGDGRLAAGRVGSAPMAPAAPARDRSIGLSACTWIPASMTIPCCRMVPVYVRVPVHESHRPRLRAGLMRRDRWGRWRSIGWCTAVI